MLLFCNHLWHHFIFKRRLSTFFFFFTPNNDSCFLQFTQCGGVRPQTSSSSSGFVSPQLIFESDPATVFVFLSLSLSFLSPQQSGLEELLTLSAETHLMNIQAPFFPPVRLRYCFQVQLLHCLSP